jgi:glycosyltransferase involved in cell wall biosynthesis
VKIVFLTHPDFFTSYSMPRFTKMLSQNMRERGHRVEVWCPAARLSKVGMPKSIKKWLIYIDQYIIFRVELQIRVMKSQPDTLFVATDQALGLWIPAIVKRKHIIHCHDMLALRCALGEIPGEKISWTGRQYQHLIRWGYQKGRNFVSVSNKTRQELHRFMDAEPNVSEVIYNGLNQAFAPGDVYRSRLEISSRLGLDLTRGYLLHIGGNQWYKNRIGVIDMYDAWRKTNTMALPILMLGQKAVPDLVQRYQSSPFKEDIHLLSGIDDDIIKLAYKGAMVFVFPSLAEGFGWPIAEAMASGCPVITTNEAPMTEVSGEAAFLIPARPEVDAEAVFWANSAAATVNKIIAFSPEERSAVIKAGLANARRFDVKISIDKTELLYRKILDTEVV